MLGKMQITALAAKNRTRILAILFVAGSILLLLHTYHMPLKQVVCTSYVQEPREEEIVNREATIRLAPQQQQEAEDQCKNHMPWYEVAKTTKTDKINPHAYDYMYEKYLSQLLSRNKKVKFLEIGLGCNMKYGPGESLKVWKKYFECLGDKFELHFMEYNAECARKWQSQYPDIPFHVGDQANTTDLERLLTNSRGEFDVIVDDGGHTMAQQIISLEFLLSKALKPGGIYFLEDLTSSFYTDPSQKYNGMFTVDFITNTINDLHRTEFRPSKPRSGWLHSHILAVDCMRALCVFTKMPDPRPPGLVGKQIA